MLDNLKIKIYIVIYYQFYCKIKMTKFLRKLNYLLIEIKNYKILPTFIISKLVVEL